MDAATLERDVLGCHVARRSFATLAEAARDADQTGEFAEQDFAVSLDAVWLRAPSGLFLEYGFVAAGGGAWYSKTLKQLQPGNHVFAYISKGNGVGGYVGLGEVTAPAMLANDYLVERDGKRIPITELARADMARGGTTDPDLAEWVVPVSWIESLPREEAIKDSDFFANQNSAVRLTHGYTLSRLQDAFKSDVNTDAATAGP